MSATRRTIVDPFGMTSFVDVDGQSIAGIASLSADATRLVFTKDGDLHVSTRSSASLPFPTASPLPNLNTGEPESEPFIAKSGVYFARRYTANPAQLFYAASPTYSRTPRRSPSSRPRPSSNRTGSRPTAAGSTSRARS